MLYVLFVGIIVMLIIDFLILKKNNIKWIFFSLVLFSFLTYLSNKNSLLSFQWIQCLLMLISYLTMFYIHNRKKKNRFYIILLFLLCSFYCEFFIFNFRHFTTFFYKEQIIKNYDIAYKENKKIKLSFIKINHVNKNVYNIYLDVKVKNVNTIFPIEIKATDEGNKNLYSLRTHKYITTIPRSYYFNTHFYGKAKYIVLDVTALGENIKIKKISINKNVPLFFDFLRFLTLFILLCLLYSIRPNSSLYQYKLLDKVKYKKLIFIFYIIICTIVFFCLVNINPSFFHKKVDSYNEYYDLTESLLNGHFYLNEKVPKILKNMDNPYDNVERIRLFKKNGLKSLYKWDYAYYKGKFYVYFGILPVIILFLPFYVLFHIHLPLHYAIFIFLIFGVCNALYFVYQLCKKYFKKVSLVSYFLGVTMLIFTSGFVFIARRPDIYLIPIINALDFTFLGLGLWLDASSSNKNKKIKIFFGSLFIALTSACRPQFLISFLLFYPILKDEFYKNKKLNIKMIISFIIPFIVIGILVMYYNYARFGSVFDFGAHYNLTTNDMIHRGLNLDRIGLGIFTYLFQPVNVVQTFPYISLNILESNYLGTIIFEPFMGGLFFSTSVALLGFYVLKNRKVFNKNLFVFSLISYICALIIIIFDTQMAGLLPRYICDFAWLFLIPTLFTVFYFDEINDKNKQYIFRKIFGVLLLISLLYQFCIIFKYIDMNFEQYSPDIFHAVRYFVEFWL